VTPIDGHYLRELIETHGGALALYARQWCRAPEDAVQEALIDLLKQDPEPDCPVAWLYTAVRRRAMNLARADNRREKHHCQAGQEREYWFLPPEDEQVDSVDVQELLAQLPSMDREIVVVRIWGELTFEQIADLVDQSASTVHRRYQRALSELGRLFEQLEGTKHNDERQSTIS
jgi:RNA polymerase sigma factor (sigma-70 family)